MGLRVGFMIVQKTMNIIQAMNICSAFTRELKTLIALLATLLLPIHSARQHLLEQGC
jgi:hypothetical protein